MLIRLIRSFESQEKIAPITQFLSSIAANHAMKTVQETAIQK